MAFSGLRRRDGFKREISANAHDTRDAGCLGLFALISIKRLLFKGESQREITYNSLKPQILGFQDRSRSPMLIPLKRSSPVLLNDKQHVSAYLQPFSR